MIKLIWKMESACRLLSIELLKYSKWPMVSEIAFLSFFDMKEWSDVIGGSLNRFAMLKSICIHVLIEMSHMVTMTFQNSNNSTIRILDRYEAAIGHDRECLQSFRRIRFGLYSSFRYNWTKGNAFPRPPAPPLGNAFPPKSFPCVRM